MIQILFSPSEGKNFQSEHQELRVLGGIEPREEILHAYNSIIKENNLTTLATLFGIKKEEEIIKYTQDIFNSPTTKAIKRYDGVAYDYLQYHTLDEKAQHYLDNFMLIFSNLFGVLRADDLIPVYKVKQGNAIAGIKPELYYKEKLKPLLDEHLKEKEVLDLRAGYYDKFYKVTTPYTTLKFLKNNKVVSHWAKAYRGIVAREMAKHNIQSLKELQGLEIANLIIKEIKQIKNKTEIVYEIID